MGKIVIALLLLLAANLVYGQPLASSNYVELTPTHFKPIPHTDKNMSVLILDTPLDGELGVITDSGICAGASAYRGQDRIGIAVWEDSPKTPDIDGAVEGEQLYLHYADKNGVAKILNYDIVEGYDTFKADELLVIRCVDSKSTKTKKATRPAAQKPAPTPSKPSPENSAAIDNEPAAKHFKLLPRTDKNMSVLIVDTPPNGEFGLFTESGLCPAVTAYENQDKIGLALWGDSDKTSKVDGAIQGEPFQICYADEDGPIYNSEYEIVQGKDIYEADEFLVVRWLDTKFSDPRYGIIKPGANSIEKVNNITISLKNPSQIELSLHQLSGKKVTLIAAGPRAAGNHQFEIDPSKVSSGTYILKLRVGNKVTKREMVYGK